MKLVIVESPAKCQKIEKYLGNGYKCIASFGHIRQLGDNKDGLKCIDIENDFKPTYKNLLSKAKNIKQMRECIKKASEVILATDDDREGEAIAWHICKLFNLPVATTKRIIFHEITKPALQRAVQNCITLDMNKVHAQQARQILDKLVGFTLSPLLYDNISRNVQGGLSAGRCQTPTLRLVYEQELEIKKSPGEKEYETEGDFMKKIPFKLNHNFVTEDETVEFLENNVDFNHTYDVSEPRKVSKKPPIPFSTSGLQQKSSNELGYSPKQTMRLAQTLYESGYITYMRTDNKVYSVEFIKSAVKHIDTKYGKEYVGKTLGTITLGEKKTKKKKNDTAQEAHEAIRPTNIMKEELEIKGKITNKERRLYDLIWRNTIESCMSNAVYNSIKASITAPDIKKGKKILKKHYTHTTEKCIFPGWKIVEGVSIDDDFELYDYLSKTKKGIRVKYSEIRSRVAMKNLKSHFTEARLINQLEKLGIGRPSTFSSLVSKVQDRNYVKKGDIEGKKINCVDFRLVGDELEEFENTRKFGGEKNKLILQPLGLMVIEFLLKWFDSMFVYDYTKLMEDDLDKISKGNKRWQSLCESCYNDMSDLIESVPKSKSRKKGIVVDEYHTYIIGKHGPCLKYDKDGKTSFKKVKKNIDLEKLKNGEYKLEDLLDTVNYGNNILGNYKNKEIVLKNGKYGPYITYDDKNYSIKNVDPKRITLEDAIHAISVPKTASGILKQFNTDTDESISIRKGKFGPYIYYKTTKMKKPKFVGLKKKKWNDLTLIEVRELL